MENLKVVLGKPLVADVELDILFRGRIDAHGTAIAGYASSKGCTPEAGWRLTVVFSPWA